MKKEESREVQERPPWLSLPNKLHKQIPISPVIDSARRWLWAGKRGEKDQTHDLGVWQ